MAFKFINLSEPGKTKKQPAAARPASASTIPGAAGQNRLMTGGALPDANLAPRPAPPTARPEVDPAAALVLPPPVNPMSAKFSAMWNVPVLAKDIEARDALIADIKVSILASRALRVEEREFSSELFSITSTNKADRSLRRTQYGYTKPQRGTQTSAPTTSMQMTMIKHKFGDAASVTMNVHSHPSTRGTPETQETFSRPQRNKDGEYEGDLVEAAQNPDMKYGLLTPKGGFLTVQSKEQPIKEITPDVLPIINTKIAAQIDPVIRAGGPWNPARSNLLKDVQDRIKELGPTLRGPELSKYDRRFGRQMRRAENRSADLVGTH